MLKKCFKYDFAYVIKIWWLAAISLISVSFGAGWGFRNINIYSNAPNKFFILEYVLIVVYIIAAGAFAILTQVLLCTRFYTNFFSDEGYLTFTLHVKRSTLLCSKVLSGFLCEIMTYFTIISSVIIVTLMIPSQHKEFNNVFYEFIFEFKEFFFNVPINERIWISVYLIEFLIISILLLLALCVVLYMLITLGATLVKKFKIGAIIGFMVLADYIYSILFVGSGISFVLWFNAGTYLYGEKLSETNTFFLIFFVMILISIMISTVVLLFVNITQGLINRKLNLQ